jgi:hypothetical protein
MLIGPNVVLQARPDFQALAARERQKGGYHTTLLWPTATGAGLVGAAIGLGLRAAAVF